MSFISIEFILFLPLVSALFFCVPVRFRWIVLLLASYFFYATWNPWYLTLIIGTTLFSYFSALKVSSSEGKLREFYLYLGVGGNLLNLFVFKYFNFFNQEFNAFLSSQGFEVALVGLDIVLPVAISFYTFQVVGYIIDVYRDRNAVEPSLGTFGLYVVFYPQLVAGPIERSKHFLPQIRAMRDSTLSSRFDFDYDRTVSGLRLILLGLAKKIIVADNLANYVNYVYNSVDAVPGGYLLIATYAFAFQILFDFSAYTDIARGAARIVGVDLMRNFNNPYLATSVSDFWRRWHISLSSWFRDYVYIPLGGSRQSKAHWAFVIMVVFLLSGAWHGANWTFIVWGALHGFYYLIERIVVSPISKKAMLFAPLMFGGRFFAFVRVCIVFNLVCFAWIFFRANDIEDAIYVVTTIFDHSIATFEYRLMGLFSNVPEPDPDSILSLRGAVSSFLEIGRGGYAILVAFFFIFCGVLAEKGWSISRLQRPFRWAVYYTAILMIFLIGSIGAEQFIYFQF